jgi:hypothetical protein
MSTTSTLSWKRQVTLLFAPRIGVSFSTLRSYIHTLHTQHYSILNTIPYRPDRLHYKELTCGKIKALTVALNAINLSLSCLFIDNDQTNTSVLTKQLTVF